MRLRLIFALVICPLLGASSSFAQNFTAVSGTIVDPNGLPYSNCNITAELVPAGTNPSIGGAAIGGLNRANCDVNGAFSMTLGSNAVILPGGTQWKFTVNEQPGIPPPAGFGPQSFNTVITISGASQNISVALAVPALALARVGAGGTLGGVTAYDAAFRPNGAIGTNWTVTSNALNISTNQIIGTSNGINAAFWSVNSFSPLQFSQASIPTLNGTTDLPGVTVLAQSSGANFFDCVENSTTLFLRRVVNGVPTTLNSVASAGAAFDALRLENWPNGNLICYKNGLSQLTAVDTTFSAGSPGLEIVGNVATVQHWRAGNLYLWGCSTVTPATVAANTAADQNLLSCIVPAFGTGFPANTLRVQLAGVFSTPAASTTAVTVKLKLCTVAGCGSGSVMTLASITSSALGGIQVTNNPFDLRVFASSADNVGGMESHGNLTIDLSAAATAAQSVFGDNNTAVIPGGFSLGAPLFLQTTVAFSVASASNSCTARQLTIQNTAWPVP